VSVDDRSDSELLCIHAAKYQATGNRYRASGMRRPAMGNI
jgi:hypothetical protein